MDRKKYPLVSPWSTEIVSVEIPVLGASILEFSNIRDRKFPELNLESYQFASYDPELGHKLLNLAVDGKTFPSFEELIAYIKTKDGKPLRSIWGILSWKPNRKFARSVFSDLDPT
ncbi:hypothetical protein LEP1GSC168_0791 [Leptospira santarosai str. HAI134]|nr:hypothetical protein LEP1GSC168_0791 [Leptospira santarosai str. HAI134]